MCRSNAARNPYAHLRQPGLTPEEVAETSIMEYPLRFGHCCPASDGACAMIITSGDKAKKMTERPAYIKACTSCSDEAAMVGIFGGGPATLDPCAQEGCKRAAREAYRLAGIKEPGKEIDVAEPYAPFANQLLMFYERLLLCDEGLDSGSMEMDGELPVCPSGGVISTNAIGASAMERVAESALQIMGKAGEHQVKRNVHNAVAHGWGGALNLNVVAVLGDTPRR